jgi:Recombinase
MLPVPTDEDFTTFVIERRSRGLSAHSIAAALNDSVWADPSGQRWHWQQVDGFCWSADDHSESGEACSRRSCQFHRRLDLLRLIQSWAPFDQDAARLISTYDAAGESASTIASRLNRGGYRTPDGTRWAARTVRVMLRLSAPDPIDIISSGELVHDETMSIAA